MKIFAAFLLLTSAASAEVVKLTPSNYAELTEGKTVFIKYFAPWYVIVVVSSIIIVTTCDDVLCSISCLQCL